ncbi:MAG: MnhB domain-containing protein [Natronomonas sp.]
MTRDATDAEDVSAEANSDADGIRPDGGQGTITRRADSPYTESEIIMTAVRIVAPFVLTYGLFMTFHGADSPGGGFQGGALIGVVVLMLAFAFGARPTAEWVGNTVVTVLVAGGVVVFVGVGLGTLGLGGAFLEYGLYEPFVGPDATKWGMEAIEIGGVAAIVSGAIMGLFFLTAAGFLSKGGEEA